MLDALTLDQLRTFLAVAEAGSFRAAAARLSRVQSAVSHAIANMEAELGVALFDRSGHRPTLSPHGRALLADTRAILLKVDAMRARARGLHEGVELELSISVDALFPLPTMVAALKDLNAAYPAVAARVAVLPLGGPFAALQERQCTLAITVGQDIREPRIELEALSSLEFVAVAATAHPLGARAADGAQLTMAELADHTQIVVEDPSPITAGRDFGVLSTNIWRVGDMEIKRALIASGIGWGRLPLWMVEQDLAQQRLTRIVAVGLGPDGATIEHTYLAWRTDEPLGPAAKALRQALLRGAKQQPGKSE